MPYAIKCEACGFKFKIEKWNPAMPCPKCKAPKTVPMTQVGTGSPTPPQGARQTRGQAAPKDWKRNPIIGVVAVVLISLIWIRMGYKAGAPKKKAQAARERAAAYNAAQMEYLGRYLAKNHSGTNVLLIQGMEYNDIAKERNEALAEALERGFDGKLTLAAVESPPKPDVGRGPMMPMMGMMLAETFDDMISIHPDCDMIVSATGLPYNYADMKLWKKPRKKRPKVALVRANSRTAGELLDKKRIVAAVVSKPGYKYDPEEVVPDDITEAFNKRYLLIDSGNIEQMRAEYPKSFKSKK